MHRKEFLNPKDEQKLSDKAQKLVVSLIPRFKNFFIEQEIFQRQGFNSAISHKNLIQTRKNLIAGFDYLKQHAKSQDDGFLAEESSYASLKHSKLGIAPEEANLFDLITRSLTIQHASPTQATYGTSLKSIRHREIEGEEVELKRTSNAMGRQNFVYFVTGIGNQVNAPGLHGLNIYNIDLNKLALHNPQKFAQLYVSPHLTEFETNASSSPCVMGNTKVDIQFDGKSQTISYRFQRSDLCVLERTYHLHDFVFYGGNDVVTGLALRFIELLRFVGNPYRQTFLARLNDSQLSSQEKVIQLSQAMTVLMPGSKIIEAKIPQEIQLQEVYSKITISETKPEVDENTGLPVGYFAAWFDHDAGREEKTATPRTPFVENLKKYALGFYAHAGINLALSPDLIEEEFAQVLEDILKEETFNGPYLIGVPDFSGHLPIDLNLFVSKLIVSTHDMSLPLIKWLLSATTKFVSPEDPELYYLLNINERESSGTEDLFLALLNARFNKEKADALLDIVFPLLNECRLRLNFSHYIAVAAHESFNKISESDRVAFLLGKNVPITQDDPGLLAWIAFEGNEKLLDYMFVKQALDINAIVHQYSWLEHAILNKKEAAVQWMLEHGAVLHRQHPEIMKVMSASIASKLGLSKVVLQEDHPSNEPIQRDAVVALVTATYPDGEEYTVMGRRRVRTKLEDIWSFPGGIVELDEKPVEAAVRELSEETSVKVDPNTATIQEFLTVKLHRRHSRQDNINHLHFVHIHLGNRLLPSVWPGDDLGEVTKAKVYESKADQSLKTHKGLAIRVSNAELFDFLKGQALTLSPERFSLLLFAEMYPLEFMKYQTELVEYIVQKLSNKDYKPYFTYDEIEPIKDDATALALLKATTLDSIQECLKKISHTIKDPDIKRSILLEAINLGNLPLLTFLIENGYPIHHLQKDDACKVDGLIKNHQWDMLQFICKQAPHLLHGGGYNWENMSSLVSSIPEENVRHMIHSMNADNLIFDKLKHLFKKQRDNFSEQRGKTLEFVKDILREHPEAVEKFKEDHVKYILLTGDVALFQLCYQQPNLAKLSFNYEYFYTFHLPPHYRESVNILQYLFDNGHKEMLTFLYEKFSKAFDMSRYIVDELRLKKEPESVYVHYRGLEGGGRSMSSAYNPGMFSSNFDSDSESETPPEPSHAEAGFTWAVEVDAP